MYYIVFIVLLLACALHLSNSKILYRIFWVALTLLLVFRYGQGTDYINYNYHYQAIGRMVSIKSVSYYGLDFGYMLINKLFGLTGLSFQWFIGFVSLFMMLSLDRYIKKYSSKPILTLFLFYPTYYLTYYSSAIAQGIVLSLFIGIMLSCLLEKKIIQYIILCVLASSIHLSGLVLFLGLLIYINKEKVYRYMIIASFLLSVVGVSLGSRLSFVRSYYGAPRIISLVEKIIWLVALIYLSRKVDLSEEENACLKLYYSGFILAIIFLWFPTVSSRLCVYYKVLETGLFSSLLYKLVGEDNLYYARKKIFSYAYVALIIVALTTAMFYKNINQYLVNGKYYNTSFFSYKYISIFEQDKLYYYRDSIFRELID